MKLRPLTLTITLTHDPVPFAPGFMPGALCGGDPPQDRPLVWGGMPTVHSHCQNNRHDQAFGMTVSVVKIVVSDIIGPTARTLEVAGTPGRGIPFENRKATKRTHDTLGDLRQIDGLIRA